MCTFLHPIIRFMICVRNCTHLWDFYTRIYLIIPKYTHLYMASTSEVESVWCHGCERNFNLNASSVSCSPPIYIRIYTCSYEYVPIYTYTYIYTFTDSRAHIPPPVHVLMVVLAKVAAGPRILQTTAAVRVSSSR